jgi:hypothetical protein
MSRGSRRRVRVKLLTERKSGKRRSKLVAVHSGWK